MAGDTSRQNGKAGGRPSAYQEKNNAADALDIWFTDRDRKAVADKIRSGTYSVRDMFIFKALGGNERILTALQKKIHPDKLDVEATGEIKVVITQYADSADTAPVQPSGEAVPTGGAEK